MIYLNNFQKRIGFTGKIYSLLLQVCSAYSLGQYISNRLILIGYEDYNLMLKTTKGQFFVKIFALFRDNTECERYVGIIDRVVKSGISHPILYRQFNGEFLYKIKIDGVEIRLVVIQYLQGKTFYELRTNPNFLEKKFIIKQAALINKIDFKPFPVYDNWAITNFPEQYEKKGKYLEKKDAETLAALAKKFKVLQISRLPHCFVHGDITKTNVLRTDNGKIYVLDFAVANYYPRIQELAVLLCDLFFNKDKRTDFRDIYKFVLEEYQKYISLTTNEIKTLPLYVQFAHAMHIICANYEKVVNGNKTAENEYFLNIGRAGLKELI